MLINWKIFYVTGFIFCSGRKKLNFHKLVGVNISGNKKEEYNAEKSKK